MMQTSQTVCRLFTHGVTSIAGRIATANQILHSASKPALAAASEALAHEVAAFACAWPSSSPA